MYMHSSHPTPYPIDFLCFYKKLHNKTGQGHNSNNPAPVFRPLKRKNTYNGLLRIRDNSYFSNIATNKAKPRLN